MASIIYLIESDQKIAQAIVNPAIKNGFEIFIFSKFSDLLNDLRENRPEAIFLRADLLPQSPDELRLLSNSYTLVYGKQFDPDKRISFYNLGIKRVVDGVHFQAGTLSLLLKHYLFSQKELPAVYLNKMIRKSLRDFSILELLQKCLVEKKSVACKIVDNEWSAKLRLNKGRLESASYPGAEGTKAVLEILHHQRGDLFLKYFSDSRSFVPFEASTPVHLLEFQYQQKLRKEFLQKCRENNPIFIKGKITEGDHFTGAEKTILKILDQKLSLKKLLKISSLSFLQTFRIIENFLQKGIIEIEIDNQENQQFSEEDFESFYEKLFNPGQKIGQILILGSSETVKHQGIETIAQSIGSQLITNNLAEITAVSLSQQVKLYFVALPLNDQIHQLLDSFVSDLVATVFIIDLDQQNEMDYPKYFLRQFLAEYSLPFVIGVTNVGENTEEAIQKVKNKLEVPSHVHLSAVDLQNFPQFRRLLLKLLDNPNT